MTRPTSGAPAQQQQAALSAALAGAVDLSALAAQKKARDQAEQRARQQAAAAERGEAPTTPTVVDVTEATFQAEVLDRSAQVPVVIDFWAQWCTPCKQLSPILEKLAAEHAGRFVLAKIDVDTSPQLATTAQVQSIPAVKAVLGGQVVAEFTGVLPEPQLREWIGALVAAAGQALGQAGDTAGAEQGPPVDQRVLDAEDALTRGDVDAAERSLRAVLAENPADPVVKAGLAQVGLVRRTTEVTDPQQTITAADAAPADVAAQRLAADVELLSGAQAAAFARLVAVVSRTSGADRDIAREHLIGLFDLFPPDDADVATARRNLTSALF